jgi:hypothetical protein
MSVLATSFSERYAYWTRQLLVLLPTSRRYLLRVNESQQQKLCSRFATATTTRRCWFLLQACALRTMWRHGLVFLGTLQTTTRRCSFHLQPPLSITSRRADLPRLSYEYLVYLAYSNISPRHNTWKIYTKHFYNITLWHAGEVINGTARRLHIYCCNIRMESWASVAHQVLPLSSCCHAEVNSRS